MSASVVDLAARRERIDAATILAEMSLSRAHALAGLVRSELGIIAEIVAAGGAGASLDSLDLEDLDRELLDAMADLERLRRRLAAAEDTKGSQ